MDQHTIQFRRQHPGVFTPVANTGVSTRGGGPEPLTPADIATRKIAFDERKRLYNECQAIEALLRNQIIEAVDITYLEPLRNTTPDMIMTQIPDIFSFLMTNYG